MKSAKRKGVLSERVSGGYAEEVVRNFIRPLLARTIRILPSYQWVNKAHVLMLARQGIISSQDASVILRSLRTIDRRGERIIGEEVMDDIYVAIETAVVADAGEEIGGKMHTGRSRNEISSTVLRMEGREMLLDALEGALSLQSSVLRLAAAHADTVMPSFTHTQIGAPMTLGFYLCAFASALNRDAQRIEASYGRLNLCPMGSGAIVGTEYPLDRELTAKLLGFDGINRNAMDSVGNYDTTIDAVFAAVLFMMNVSRVAEDLILWSNAAFAMVQLSDGYVGTSSMMPQKRNPILAEVLRSTSSFTSGNILSIMMLMRDLPSGFNMDVTQMARVASEVRQTTRQWAEIATGIFDNLKVNKDRMSVLAAEGFSTATDLANLLANKFGISFRTAHRIVGRGVRRATEENLKLDQALLKKVAQEITGREMSLDEKTIERYLDVVESVARIRSQGGSSPSEVRHQIRELGRANKEHAAWLRQRRAQLGSAREKVETMSSEFLSAA